MFKIILITATLIAASVSSFAQAPAASGAVKPATTATPVPAPAAAPTSAAPAAAKAAAVTAPSAKPIEAAPAVKKSNNNICHDESSPGYKATKNFKPFATMDECIKSGGRAPKTPDSKPKK